MAYGRSNRYSYRKPRFQSGVRTRVVYQVRSKAKFRACRRRGGGKKTCAKKANTPNYRQVYLPPTEANGIIVRPVIQVPKAGYQFTISASGRATLKRLSRELQTEEMRARRNQVIAAAPAQLRLLDSQTGSVLPATPAAPRQIAAAAAAAATPIAARTVG